MTHESVGHPYEADRILGREAAQAGESFVTKNMLGKKIGNPIVTVVDDPTVPNSYGFYLFDNEGVKARRKYLMKKGVINEFLHNRQTAAQMGLKESNGSSRATEYDRESIVRMSNTFVLPGKHTEEELIRGVKKGVYMKNFNEWNIDDKRLNQKYVGAEAFLIKNGRLEKPVLNPVVEISTPDLWSSVDAVGKKIEFHAAVCGKGEPMQGIPVAHGGPPIRLRKIRVN
jgi:TldD protein